MYKELQRAVAIGAKYGFAGIKMYADPEVDTPEIDSTAMEGAVGIVVTLAAVIIALYITALVTGSMSKTVTGCLMANGTPMQSCTAGGMNVPAAWNSTLLGMDTQANASFSLAGILPIAIVGVGILTVIIAAFAMR